MQFSKIQRADDLAKPVRKALPLGKSDFAEIIESNCYYVDKTAVISDVFKDDQSAVLLITRPRRFGKSLLMSMFRYFFALDPDLPNDNAHAKKLFGALEITKDSSFCDSFLGQLPVIYLSFKSIESSNFSYCVNMLAGQIAKIADQYRCIEQSDKLSVEQRAEFSHLLSKPWLQSHEHGDDLLLSLQNLTEFIFRHYGKKVILLIDEYDVPLAKASRNGNYEQTAELMRAFLSNALKDNPYIYKAVLTGCLRVAKESIFTGLNNLSVCSVSSDLDFCSEAVGFTHKEVHAMLSYYGLEQRSDDVRRWYDGYRIGGHEIYCPWDLICFCHGSLNFNGNMLDYRPRSFWLGTSGNDVIEEFLQYLTQNDAEKMQSLIDGNSTMINVNEQLNYREILSQHAGTDFWTLLLSTGYLTVVKVLDGDEQQSICEVKIPNLGIAECFKRNIKEFYEKNQKASRSSSEIVSMLLTGAEGFELEKVLRKLLKTFVSVRDFAVKAPPEFFYHGFLNGIISSGKALIDDYSSNTAAGDGYADITFMSSDHDIGVIIEIKQTKDDRKKIELAAKALSQTEERHYSEAFAGSRVCQIFCYGIAFCKRDCAVAVKKLDLKTSCV